SALDRRDPWAGGQIDRLGNRDRLPGDRRCAAQQAADDHLPGPGRRIAARCGHVVCVDVRTDRVRPGDVAEGVSGRYRLDLVRHGVSTEGRGAPGQLQTDDIDRGGV